MLKVLITGPESSGKSFLSDHLARYFKGEHCKEFARTYLESKGNYDYHDILKIAEGQRSEWDAIEKTKPKIVFYDTGMEVLSVWSRNKFNKVDDQINAWLESDDYDLVLLCMPNIPWVFDELRESENRRKELYVEYTRILRKYKSAVVVIDAPLADRIKQAKDAVSKLWT